MLDMTEVHDSGVPGDAPSTPPTSTLGGQRTGPPEGWLYALGSTDPASDLIDRSAFSDHDIEQIDRIMAAMGRLRAVERQLAEVAQAYMRLKETDMRAIHYLLAAENRAVTVTASDLARHLGITTASTTKLLDRLEHHGHVARHRHPSDRRALKVTVTPATRRAALDSVGRQHAPRFDPAARLDPAERDVVIRFLTETTDALAGSLPELPDD